MIPYKITNFYSRYWIKWMAFHFPDGHVTPFFFLFSQGSGHPTGQPALHHGIQRPALTGW